MWSKSIETLNPYKAIKTDIENGVVCSGACDPYDEEIFEEHWNL